MKGFQLQVGGTKIGSHSFVFYTGNDARRELSRKIVLNLNIDSVCRISKSLIVISTLKNDVIQKVMHFRYILTIYWMRTK